MLHSSHRRLACLAYRLGMHLLQVLWKVAVVHRFAGHPLHGFIDLLFLANTSAIILNERHSGYYLHGRNQMHHSGAHAVVWWQYGNSTRGHVVCLAAGAVRCKQLANAVLV